MAGRKNNQAVLVPKKKKNGKGWMVSLGILWIDGKKKNPRPNFKTRSEAQTYCNEEKARRLAHGNITAGLDGAKVAEWMKLNSKLVSAEIKLSTLEAWVDLEQKMQKSQAGNLLSAGQSNLEGYLAIQNSGTAQECFDAWHAELSQGRNERRGKYRATARNICRNFITGGIKRAKNSQVPMWKGFGGNRDVLDITPNVIESYVKLNPGNFPVISAWLGWAAKNRWVPANPCTGKRPESSSHLEVVTLTPTKAARMLYVAVESRNWEVLSHIAISIFAGLRPDEFRKVAKGDTPAFLEWSHFGNEHISLPPELCKNGRRSGKGRTVPIDPTLQSWIDYIREMKTGELSGKVLNNNWKKTWDTWRKSNWQVDEEKWPKDVLRHTFGSYHLARSKNLEETSFIMENSPKILKRHYWNWETLGSDAEIFWNLTPQKVLGTSLRVSTNA